MLKALVLLQLAALAALDKRRTARRPTMRGERGSVTTEYVLWAVAVIAIVGIVVAAVTAYVQAQSGKIK
jgi:uncharacterized membrane protein